MFPAEGLNLFYMTIYGGFGYDLSAACSTYLGLAAGIPQAGNPPFTIADFLATYPQFFGAPTTVVGTVTASSPTISVASTSGIAAGQLISSGSFPAGTVVLSFTDSTITASANATANAASVLIYEAPPIPLAVIQSFINLATASLMSSRWREMWAIAMGWYVAHFMTLFLSAMVNPGSTSQQVVAAGLAQGLTVSQAAGDVSFTQQNLEGFESWGSWQLTQFGQLLITFAQSVGAGPIYVR